MATGFSENSRPVPTAIRGADEVVGKRTRGREIVVEIPGTVETVVDGDTVRIRLDFPLTWSRPVVRLHGVDCHELDGPYRAIAAKAAAFVREKTNGKRCVLKARGTDRYGRVLANVEVEGIGDLSEAIIREGLGWAVPVKIGRPDFDHAGGSLRVSLL